MNDDVELVETIQNTATFFNLLFDLIFNLTGKIRWDTIEKNFDDVKNIYIKIKESYKKFVDIQFSEIERNLLERNPEMIPMETYNVIEKIMNFYDGLNEVEDKDIKNFILKYSDFKTIIKSSVLLNDIILGIIVEDKNIDSEIDVFLSFLGSASKKRNINLDKDYVVKLFEELKVSKKDGQAIMKLRSFLSYLFGRYFASGESKISLLSA